MGRRWTVPAAIAAVLLAGSCGEERDVSVDAPSSLTVASEGLAAGETIPKQYTCDGSDISPDLRWSGPQDTSSWAVTMIDPDAPSGAFAHWVVYDIPGSVGTIEEGALPEGAVAGVNDFGNEGYNGPCPPADDPAHHYVTTVYAVARESLGPDAGADAGDVLDALRAATEATGSLTALYDR